MTTNRMFATLIVLTCICLVSCSGDRSVDQARGARPNIIFIMTDDQANRTVSAYEGAIHQTPNIDRLADEGVVFLNSFVANSICNPARASIFTGKHSHKNGVVGNASPWDGSQTVFPRLLQEAGYTTALIGKWHLNSPPGDEFDHSYRLIGAGKQGFYYNPEFEYGDGTREVLNGHSTDLVTDKALQWLEDNTSDPFMLFVQYKDVHVPRMPEFRFLDRYVNDTIPEPETLLDDYESRAHYAREANMGIPYRPLPLLDDHDPVDDIYYSRMTREQFEKWHSYKDPEALEYQNLQETAPLEGDERLRYAYQKFIKDYLRLIDGVDENVGRLLDWLDEHPDIRDHTVVVYTSDQGYFIGEHGWAEKRFMYEEALRMPLLMRWPGQFDAGNRVEPMVQNIDLAPTFLDIAGVEIPQEMQGRSFAPLLRGETPSDWRESIYYHYYEHGGHNVPRHDGVRDDRYKLIHFYTDDAWEFYDLQEDPHEINNVYDEPVHEEVIAELKNELERLRRHYQVPEHHFEAPFVIPGEGQQL